MTGFIKKISILFTLLVLAVSTVAQSQKQFALYRYNLNVINPAFTGLQNEQTFNLHRTSIPESLISYSNSLTKIRSGIGLMFWNLGFSSIKETNISIPYSYHLKLNEKSSLSLGTELKYQKINISFSEFTSTGPSDPISFSNDRVSDSNFDFDFGLVYERNNFQIATAAKGVLKSAYKNVGISYRELRTKHNIYTAYKFVITENLKITPSILYTTDFNTGSLDLNGSVELKKLFLLGTTANFTKDEVRFNFNAGVSIKEKVQLMALVYSNLAEQYNTTKDIAVEVLLRIKIAND